MRESKIDVVCPSAFDNLGHPEYAKNIVSELITQFNCIVELYSKDYRGDDNYVNLFNKIILKVHYLKADFFGLRDSLHIKTKFLRIFGRFAGFFYKVFSFVIYIKFYANFFRKYKHKNNTILHLEFEPVSYSICSFLYSIRHKNIFVLHSVNFEHSNFIFNLYKKISLFLIKRELRKGAKLIVHSPMAYHRLVNENIDGQKIIIGGWGHGPIKLKIHRVSNDVIDCLSFGVVREDKRIKELVKLFAAANDARLRLTIAGKFVDYPSSLLKKIIKEFETKTQFIIIDRYLHDVVMENLYSKADVSVLSHAKNFNSSSGPLFKSIEFAVPILCFSYNDVREIVLSQKIGIVADLTSFNPHNLYKTCCKIKKISIKKDTFYSWRKISSRIYRGIIK